jgi:hypothetical protein
MKRWQIFGALILLTSYTETGAKLCLIAKQLLTAPVRYNLSVFAATPCRGLSLSR